MVGPSLSDEEQAIQRKRLKLFLVGVVGASGGLVALANGGSLAVVVGATLGSLLLGVILVWYLATIAPRSGI